MDTVTTLSIYIQELQEDALICGSLNFSTITHIKRPKTEMKLNSKALCQ